MAGNGCCNQRVQTVSCRDFFYGIKRWLEPELTSFPDLHSFSVHMEPPASLQHPEKSDHTAIDLNAVVTDAAAGNLGFFDSSKYDAQKAGMQLFFACPRIGSL